MTGKNKKHGFPKLVRLVAVIVFLLLPALYPEKIVQAASWCQCTQYIQNRFQLAGGVPNASDFGSYLKARGFNQVSAPQVGAVAVMQGSFGQGVTSLGHVSVITNVSDLGSYWQITTRGANQYGSQSTEYNCSDVTTYTWKNYPKSWGANYISYWYRPGVVFSTSWESGQPNSFTNWVLYSRNVAGYYNSSNPPPEAGRVPFESWATPYVHSGSYYLRVAGYSQASYSFVYLKLFDAKGPIQNGMKLSYYIYTYKGRTFAIDGHFTDGNTIRDFYNGGYLTDQNGIRIHPSAQGYYGNGYWRYVEVNLSRAAGRTLDYLMVAFDNGNNGFKGQFRAYIDDIVIKNAP